MNRQLDTEHVTLFCKHRHPSVEMKGAYYALKEAGATMTILGFECPTCYRRLYMTDDDYFTRPTPEVLAEMDAQE